MTAEERAKAIITRLMDFSAMDVSAPDWAIDVREVADAIRAAEREAAERLTRTLRAVEVHHVGLNEASGRPLTNSWTLRTVRAALAGCDHLSGDVCRHCHPSLPFCTRHPEASVRRFGALWRCGECGEEATTVCHSTVCQHASGGGSSGEGGGK